MHLPLRYIRGRWIGLLGSVALFSAAAPGEAELKATHWLTPKDLTRAIKRQGLSQVAARLPRTPDGWDYVLNQVRAGDRRWIRAVRRLRPGLRGKAYQDWAGAMEYALERRASYALPKLRREDIDRVCSPVRDDTDYFNEELAVRHVERMIRGVRGFLAIKPSTREKQARCLQRLSENRRGIPDLFKRD